MGQGRQCGEASRQGHRGARGDPLIAKTDIRHLLLFDIDGTLIHADSAGRIALTRALTAEFGVEDPSIVVGFAGRTDRAIASEALIRHGMEADDDRFARFHDAYLALLPEALAERAGHVLPGARELLVALAERPDVVLALLTGNFEQAARKKLGHFDLDAFFIEPGGFGDHHHDRNDVARAAEAAVSGHIGADTLLWVVGDTPNDVRCARAIGARAVAVTGGFGKRAELEASDPDHLLDDLCDVEGFFALLDGD